MRRFLASAWFPFLTAVVLAACTVGGLLWIKVNPADIGNYDAENIIKYAQWGVGPLVGLLSWILGGILNLLRRLFRIRKVFWLHPIVALVSIAPWIAFSWQMTMNEPRFTLVAKMIIDFAGRPIFLGCTGAILFIVIVTLLSLLSRKKS